MSDDLINKPRWGELGLGLGWNWSWAPKVINMQPSLSITWLLGTVNSHGGLARLFCTLFQSFGDLFNWEWYWERFVQSSLVHARSPICGKKIWIWNDYLLSETTPCYLAISNIKKAIQNHMHWVQGNFNNSRMQVYHAFEWAWLYI